LPLAGQKIPVHGRKCPADSIQVDSCLVRLCRARAKSTFAIAQNMRGDVVGYQAVSDSLSRGPPAHRRGEAAHSLRLDP
jgi:hypothetical protein